MIVPNAQVKHTTTRTYEVGYYAGKPSVFNTLKEARQEFKKTDYGLYATITARTVVKTVITTEDFIQGNR